MKNNKENQLDCEKLDSQNLKNIFIKNEDCQLERNCSRINAYKHIDG